MTTNQLSECQHMLRQAMLYPASNHVIQRLKSLDKDVKEQIEDKIFKMNASRLLFMLMQDRCTRDGFKIIERSKEMRGKMAKALLAHIEEIHHPNEIILISGLFPKI